MKIQDIGKRIKELRQKLNLTQRELAQKLGITAAALSSYEKGSTNPSIAVIADIAEITNVSTDWLLGLSDTTTIEKNITTYSDILHLVVKLTRVEDIGVKLAKNDIVKDCYLISFEHPILAEMLEKYSDALRLYEKGTISDEILAAVIEKLEKDYDREIEPIFLF